MTVSWRDFDSSRARSQWPRYAAFALAIAVAGGCAPRGASVRVERAFLVLPAGSAPAALYFNLRNSGREADTLTGIAVDAAGRTSMHDERQEQMPMAGGAMGAMMQMVPVSFVAIPGAGTVAFAPGGLHGMVEQLDRPLVRGDTVRVTFKLAHEPPLSAAAHVITYGDLDTAVAPSSRH